MDSNNSTTISSFIEGFLLEYFSKTLHEHRKYNEEYDRIVLSCLEAETPIHDLIMQENSPVDYYCSRIVEKYAYEKQFLYLKGAIDTVEILRKIKAI